MMPFLAFSLGEREENVASFKGHLSVPDNPFAALHLFLLFHVRDYAWMVHINVDFPAVLEPKTPVIPPLRHSKLKNC